MVTPASMSSRERLSLLLLYAALLVLLFQLGGSLYEHLTIDTVWLGNPALIQPERGGVNRKLFWIPMHGAATLLLPLSLWAVWKHRRARAAMWIAVGLYVVIRVWTMLYFVPEALAFETAGELTPEQLAAARRWISMSLLRLPLLIGSTFALWVAVSRYRALQPKV